MEDSVLLEFAQFVCAGVMAMGNHITPIACVGFEVIKSMTRLVRLIMVKGCHSLRYQSLEYFGATDLVEETVDPSMASHLTVSSQTSYKMKILMMIIEFLMVGLMIFGAYCLIKVVMEKLRKGRIPGQRPVSEMAPEEDPYLSLIHI